MDEISAHTTTEPTDPTRTTPATTMAGSTRRESYSGPRYPTRINPDPLPPNHPAPLPDVVTSTSHTTEVSPATSDEAVTSTAGDTIVFSLREAIKAHYGPTYTRKQIQDAFQAPAVREYFSHEWSRLYEQARTHHVDGNPTFHGEDSSTGISYLSSTSAKLCWYHWRYKKNARKCRQPCRYKVQILLPNSVVRNWPCLVHSRAANSIIVCDPPCPIQFPQAGQERGNTKPPQQ